MTKKAFFTFDRQDLVQWLPAYTVPQQLQSSPLALLVSAEEMAEVYLPLSHLLYLHISQTRSSQHMWENFFQQAWPHSPYIIGITGSSASGKSTFAQVLKELFLLFPEQPRVEIVSTDGFLLPNRILHERGILEKKGFPKSYDWKRFLQFMLEMKTGAPEAQIPVYSHLLYDLVPDQVQTISQPDILLIEGVNLLHPQTTVTATPIQSLFDLLIYLDAEEEHLFSWFMKRFHEFLSLARNAPQSYYCDLANLPDDEAISIGEQAWYEINLPNLRTHIHPQRHRAKLIVKKGAEHQVEKVHWRTW
ncbi:type I pantothenate kinase [Laceyella putida]|uniref:Pantothenate kinase n=1 Tax=Laceyella putida TaxID=110101 RepID=A0ABW2RHB6_9BACL